MLDPLRLQHHGIVYRTALVVASGIERTKIQRLAREVDPTQLFSSAIALLARATVRTD